MNPLNCTSAHPDHFDASKFDKDGRPTDQPLKTAGRKRAIPAEKRAEIYELMKTIRDSKARIEQIFDECKVSPYGQARGVKLTRIWREKGA